MFLTFFSDCHHCYDFLFILLIYFSGCVPIAEVIALASPSQALIFPAKEKKGRENANSQAPIFPAKETN